MKILVLGSGAGGGYPQWNCNCELCGGLRRGSTHATPRTQSSIAVSADGERWLLQALACGRHVGRIEDIRVGGDPAAAYPDFGHRARGAGHARDQTAQHLAKPVECEWYPK